jgi:biotin synthase
MDLAKRSMSGPALSTAELKGLLGPDIPLLPLLHEAFLVREASFGRRVRVHILSNAQNARCSEDCGYCSQSNESKARVKPYAWKPRSELLEEARRAAQAGAFRFCMAGSGRSPTASQVQTLAETVRQIKQQVGIEVCVSVGLIDESTARILKEAGVDRLNHNLNTSEARYSEICSTHDYADRVSTIEAAQSVGLELCSGMIVGMGESDGEIVEVALELRRLQVPSIPVNFLIPIEGNRLQPDGSITPERALRVLCVFRLANPTAEIRMAAGREGHLGAMQPLVLFPANSLFCEGYLTTRGSSTASTYKMIRDAGFVVERADGSVAPWEELGVDNIYRVSGSEEILKPEVVQRLG